MLFLSFLHIYIMQKKRLLDLVNLDTDDESNKIEWVETQEKKVFKTLNKRK